MRSWIASLKNRIADLFNHDIDIQERNFRLISEISATGLTVMLIVAIVLGESILDILMIFFGLGIFMWIVGVSIRRQRIPQGAAVISFAMVFVLLPIVFVASGGMYGGTPMWFIHAAIFISLLLRGRMRIALLVGDGVVLIVCYCIQWYFPELITAHTASAAYSDSLLSTLIVGVLTSVMVIFEARLYIEEQQLSEAESTARAAQERLHHEDKDQICQKRKGQVPWPS